MDELKNQVWRLYRRAGYLNLYVSVKEAEKEKPDAFRLKRELENIRRNVLEIEDALSRFSAD